jgi:ParB family chromosome partitioning protein
LVAEPMNEIRVSIESVKVVGRHRRDLGDIEALAKSIADVGLINPITLTPDSVLIAGERRLAAARSLGWADIAARVVDSLADAATRLRIERDENTERKEMLVSERVALAKALEALESDRIAEKQHADRVRAGRIRQGSISARCSEEQRAEPAREVAARAVELASSTYYKARKVVEAAEDPTLSPEQGNIARTAMADMDATGNVAGNYEKVRNMRASTLGSPQPTRIHSAGQQRKAISVADTAMSGICHGLKQITELHPDITREEAARWLDGLSKSRQVIESLIKQLRERINART